MYEYKHNYNWTALKPIAKIEMIIIIPLACKPDNKFKISFIENDMK
jgi:hypothetical protein